MEYHAYFDKYEGRGSVSVFDLCSSDMDKMFCGLTKACSMGEFVPLGYLVKMLLSTPVSKRKSLFVPKKTTVKCGAFRSTETESVCVETLPDDVIHLIWRREYSDTKNGKENSFSESARLVISSTFPNDGRVVRNFVGI